MERRIITTEVTAEDERIETTLRPQHLKDYIGQERRLDTTDIDTTAAKAHIDEIMANREEICRTLDGQRARLAALADENARIACELLRAADNAERV